MALNAPTSYVYQWYRDGAAITGATSPSYTVQSADEGCSLTCTVTATNAVGSITVTTTSTDSVADTGTTPFAASFYRPLPASQGTDPNSASIMAVVRSAIVTPEGTATSGAYAIGLNCGSSGFPMFTVSSSVAPVPISLSSSYGHSLQSGFPASLPIPTAAVAERPITSGRQPGSDYPLIIVDADTETTYELWQATPDDSSGSSWHCTNAGYYPCTPDGSGAGLAGGATALAASGLSYTATLLTQADITAGAARHMLAWALPIGATPSQAPATAGDMSAVPGGHTLAAYPREGTIYRFPAGTVISSSWPLVERIIGTAIRDYGAICMDFAGAPQVQCQGPLDGMAGSNDPLSEAISADGRQEYNVLDDLPWATLEVVAAPTSWPTW